MVYISVAISVVNLFLSFMLIRRWMTLNKIAGELLDQERDKSALLNFRRSS